MVIIGCKCCDYVIIFTSLLFSYYNKAFISQLNSTNFHCSHSYDDIDQHWHLFDDEIVEYSLNGKKPNNIDVTTESSRNNQFVYILFYEMEDIAEFTKDIIEENLANDIEIEPPQYEIEDCENEIISANLVSSYSTDTETINIFYF